MQSESVNINIEFLKDSISKLEKETLRLINLKEQIINEKEDYILAEMQGKINDTIIENLDYIINEMNKKITMLTNKITFLKKCYLMYYNSFNIFKKKTGGV